jgi:hypothetical protein
VIDMMGRAYGMNPGSGRRGECRTDNMGRWNSLGSAR